MWRFLSVEEIIFFCWNLMSIVHLPIDCIVDKNVKLWQSWLCSQENTFLSRFQGLTLFEMNELLRLHFSWHYFPSLEYGNFWSFSRSCSRVSSIKMDVFNSILCHNVHHFIIMIMQVSMRGFFKAETITVYSGKIQNDLRAFGVQEWRVLSS